MAAESLKMTVHGMTCGNCARSVERKLAATTGVSKVSVDLVNQTAIVEYDSAEVQPEALAAAVRQIGFAVPS
jgi:copper chaperone CopZ